MRKIIFSLLCVSSFMAANVDMNEPVPFAESLKVSAAAMNKSLPVMVDDELRHDKVVIEDMTMTFKFTLVNFTEAEMSGSKLKSLMEKDIKQGLCSDEDSRMMLKRGMQVIYDYSDKSGKHITDFNYSAKDCGITSIDSTSEIVDDQNYSK